jgi:uncharacterized protein (TIGR04255 family)
VSSHPSYKHPTIQEALCEVRFDMPDPSPWAPGKPSLLAEKLRPDYPEFETITEQNFGFLAGPKGIEPKTFGSKLKLKFLRRDRPIQLQFGDDTFVINLLPAYPGWEAFKRELLRLWPTVLDVMQPTGIKRIGMRYINRIPRKSAQETPSYWLRATDNIPESLLRSAPPFLLRMELSKAQSERQILTINHDKTRTDEPFGSLMFDIDRVSENKSGVEASALEATTARLHDDIWEIFNNAKNDRYTKLLDGEMERESAA